MKTAVQIRQDLIRQREAYGRLAKQPENQAEEIARHYLAHAMIAKQILELIDMRREFAPGTFAAADYVINCLITQIKDDHRFDLGLALEWA